MDLANFRSLNSKLTIKQIRAQNNKLLLFGHQTPFLNIILTKGDLLNQIDFDLNIYIL